MKKEYNDPIIEVTSFEYEKAMSDGVFYDGGGNIPGYTTSGSDSGDWD